LRGEGSLARRNHKKGGLGKEKKARKGGRVGWSKNVKKNERMKGITTKNKKKQLKEENT